MRVLIVDDERAVRNALRRAFTLAGYEVDEADDGEAGDAMLRTRRPTWSCSTC